MSWTPRHHHISQLQVDPATGALTGRNDCLEAALARYVFEATKLTTPWTSDDAAINLVSLAARGAADTPNNPDTTLPEAAAALAHWGLPVDWTTDFQTALNAPWALCLVDGTGLAPAQYPANWFPSAGQANHFLLWLPKWQGSTNWFNDPLAFANGQQDCQYDLNSMAGAFYGAYLLPSTGNGETPPLPWRNARGQSFGLLCQPRHGATALAVVPVGGTGLLEVGVSTDAAGELWRRCQWRMFHGWAPEAYLGAVPAEAAVAQ